MMNVPGPRSAASATASAVTAAAAGTQAAAAGGGEGATTRAASATGSPGLAPPTERRPLDSAPPPAAPRPWTSGVEGVVRGQGSSFHMGIGPQVRTPSPAGTAVRRPLLGKSARRSYINTDAARGFLSSKHRRRQTGQFYRPGAPRSFPPPPP
ncbi:unnamed protein product, partial [Ascophyllum nodosum]